MLPIAFPAAAHERRATPHAPFVLYPRQALYGLCARQARRSALALTLGACSLAALACDENGGPRQTDPDAFAWDSTIAAPGIVRIRNTVGPISVSPSADGQVHVRAGVTWSRGDPKQDVRYSVVPEGRGITVCAVWGSGACTATSYNSGGRHKNGISVSVNGPTDARVAFAVEVPAGIRIDAWTFTGDVTVRAGAPVAVHTIDGDVKVGTSVGPVVAETINGDVDVRMTTVGDTGTVRAETKNGDAVAYVPEITDGVVAASTMNGKIGSDFGEFATRKDGFSKRFDWTAGAGSRRYEVSSFNGSAYIRLINPDGTVTPRETVATARPPATSASDRPRQQ